MHRSAALCALTLAALFAPRLAWSTTLLSLSGTGELELTAAGDIWLSTEDLDLVNVSLAADDRITVTADALVPPASPDALAVYSGLSGQTALHFDDDVFLADFVFQGSIALRAANIFVSGELVASGDVDIGLPSLPPIDCQARPGVILGDGTSGGTLAPGDCGEPVLLPPPVLPPLDVAPVPEPAAALLFLAGAAIVALRLRTPR